jgi:hypothetical protein
LLIRPTQGQFFCLLHFAPCENSKMAVRKSETKLLAVSAFSRCAQILRSPPRSRTVSCQMLSIGYNIVVLNTFIRLAVSRGLSPRSCTA